MRRSALLSLAAVAALFIASCTGGGEERPTASPTPEYWRGGTLRLADGFSEGAFDPQKAYWYDYWEILRCCLARTLLSYNGRPTEEGGSEVRPDLAAAFPEVSSDGLVWRFDLKEGIRYAPPFQDTEIVSGDFVRALEREADPGVTPSADCPDYTVCGYPFYYSIVEGFDAYRAGDADSISGLETPDDHTLVIRLTEPSGDLAYRLAMPAAAPIPEGAADGHDRDYGPFLVASGPYMFEGAADLDFSLPAKEQEPASGYVFHESYTLVRNPSWEPATDHLRPAYVNRIEFTMPPIPETTEETRRTLRRLSAQVDAGRLDMVFSWSRPMADQVRRYQEDPDLRDRIVVGEGNTIDFLPMNLAVPPFDDIHVRKAVNLVIDKEAIRQRLSEQWLRRDAAITTHIIPDSLEGGLLVDFRPTWAPTLGPDLDRARAEMRLSAYDGNGDGRCDAPACHRTVVLAQRGIPGEIRRFGWPSLVRDGLAAIGITPRFRVLDVDPLMESMIFPGERWGLALCTACGWVADYLDGSNFIVPLLYGPSVGVQYNYSLLGATPEQLADFGYRGREVPSADDRIERCLPMTGQDLTECWADLDRFLMEEIVPWVPVVVETAAWIVSDRVAHHSFSQWTGLPALDQIALVEGSE